MRAEKQLLLDEIQDKMTGAKAILVTRYQGLGANAANELRVAVRQSGGDFEVVSKRILRRAAADCKLDLEGIDMSGHIGVVVSTQDPVETTKVVIQFGKERDGVVKVLGGQIEGVTYGAAQIERLSKLPGLEGMRAQVLGLLEAPMSGTLGTMEALLTSLLYCLENKAHKASV